MAEDSIDTWLKRIQGTARQFRFAGVLALTRTAFGARKSVQKKLSQVFILRNKFTQRGIRVEPAKPRKEEAEVFSVDQYIADHETGGRRMVPASTREFRIPTFLREVAGIPEDKRPPKPLRPTSLLKKIEGQGRLPVIGGGKPFIATGKDGGRGIYTREGAKRLPIRLLYAIQEAPIQLKKVEWFQPTVAEYYDKNFDQIYAKALVESLRSAR